ncbi:MAG: hypothetical protein RBT76_13360 [candidate division Zixibacteria bacterium]|nr:hypothetical protein [candidate division Zixibacteria bacterium]
MGTLRGGEAIKDKYTGPYRRFDLDQRANQYVFKCVSEMFWYGKLDLALLQLISPNQGKVFTYLPDDYEPDHMYRFEESWLADGRSTVPYMEKHVRTFLQSAPDRIAVGQAKLLSRGDKWVPKIQSPVYFDQDRVYWSLSDEDARKHTRDWMQLNITGDWQPCLFLTSLPKEMRPPDGSDLTSEQCEYMASHTEVIILSVYDYDGYLIWELR